jgi:hypothetical protein
LVVVNERDRVGARHGFAHDRPMPPQAAVAPESCSVRAVTAQFVMDAIQTNTTQPPPKRERRWLARFFANGVTSGSTGQRSASV